MAQITFTLILVIAAGLFVRTLYGLMARGPGFDTSSLISFTVRGAQDSNRLIRQIHEEIRSSPNTESSALVQVPLLFGGVWGNPLTIQSTERFVTDRDVN
jgi:hypothetical protein